MASQTQADTEHLRQQLLVFIQQFSTQRGYPPSYREIAQACGRTLSSISAHLRVLCQRGLLVRDHARRRRAFRLQAPDSDLSPTDNIVIRLPLRTWAEWEQAYQQTELPIAQPVVPLPNGTWMPHRRRSR